MAGFYHFSYRSPKNQLKYRYRHDFSLYSPFLVLHSPSPINCFLFLISCSLLPVSLPIPCSSFNVPYSLFFVSCSLFPVPCLSVPLVDVNKARQTDRQTLPSSSGCRTSLLDSSCFIPFLRSTIAFLRARKWSLFHIYSSTFIYVILFLKQIYPFSIFLIIFKLCIYAESISLLQTTNSLIVIVFKNSLYLLIYLPSCYRIVCYGTVQ